MSEGQVGPVKRDPASPVTCPLCMSPFFYVTNTWTVKNGDVHRARVCGLCESWGYISVEKPAITSNGNIKETSALQPREEYTEVVNKTRKKRKQENETD